MVVNVDSKKNISRDFNVSHIGNHLPLMKSSLSSNNSIELFTQFYRVGRDIVSLYWYSFPISSKSISHFSESYPWQFPAAGGLAARDLQSYLHAVGEGVVEILHCASEI